MGKFFVPPKWDKVGETIKFKSLPGNLSTPNIKKKKPKKKKHEAKAEENVSIKEPKTVEVKISKVKSGRIEKKKGKKEAKNQLNMSRIKAAAAAFEGDNSKTMTITTTNAIKTTSTPFEARLKEQLMGGRFRFLNEQLYTINSCDAEKLFREDPEAFHAYHAGYRHQVEKWPTNPLNRMIKAIRRLPKGLEIGDFGCGEGKLAKSVPHKVHSMDLVSCREDIIACDMASTPLANQSLDVAVYCLSLMGTNLKDYLFEANRVLKIGALMLIAEIQSRFEDVHQFVRCLEACGFELLKKDTNGKIFYFFEFKKVRNVGKVAILPSCELKPCLYRKR